MRCMILCAGFGTRLNPLTLDMPKPLMEILGTPIIEIQLNALSQAGVNYAVLNSHYLGDQLQARLGNEFAGIEIIYSPEQTILGTGGGLKKAEKYFVDQKSFFLLHGDVLIDLDYAALGLFHDRHSPISTMVLKKERGFMGTRPVGTDQHQKVSSFLGAHTGNSTVTEAMFCGIHALSPAIFDALPESQNYCITAEAYPKLVAQGSAVMGFFFDGYFSDIGTIDQYFNTNMKLLDGSIRLNTMDIFSRFKVNSPLKAHQADDLKTAIWLGKHVDTNNQNIIGPCLIDDGAIIGANATVGPYAIIGKGAIVNENAHVSNSILLSGAQAKRGEQLKREIRTANHSVIIGRKQDC